MTEQKRPTIGKTVGEEIKASRVSYNRDPNFVYRVVNSDDSRYAGRIEELKKIGYILCTEEEMGDEVGVEGSSVGSAIGRPVGHGVRGVTMKIPREYYEEDQRAKQLDVDQTEEGMVDNELLSNENAVGEGLKVTRPSVNVQQNN
jgi:hypothetical protein